MQWLKHAFAVDTPASAEPDAEERLVVDRLCEEVVRRRLTTPALLYLEVARPLGYLGSQAMHFFRPIVGVLFNTRGYNRFARYLERRGSIDHICQRLDELENAYERRQRHPAPTTDPPPANPPATDPRPTAPPFDAAGKEESS